MGKFSGILICSDFDGTLAVGRDISDENIKAIRYFQSEGGLFTVATGRYPSYIAEFEDKFVPNTHRICLNGALICDNNLNPVYEKKIPFSDACELFAFINDNCTDLERILVYGANGTRENEMP